MRRLKKTSWVWGNSSVGKVLARQVWGPEFRSPAPMSINPWGGRSHVIPSSCWPASPAESVSFRISERSCIDRILLLNNNNNSNNNNNVGRYRARPVTSTSDSHMHKHLHMQAPQAEAHRRKPHCAVVIAKSCSEDQGKPLTIILESMQVLPYLTVCRWIWW